MPILIPYNRLTQNHFHILFPSHLPYTPRQGGRGDDEEEAVQTQALHLLRRVVLAESPVGRQAAVLPGSRMARRRKTAKTWQRHNHLETADDVSTHEKCHPRVQEERAGQE